MNNNVNKKTNIDAVLIGYKKVGTTLLRNFFDEHPQIDWSREGAYFLLSDTKIENKKDDYINKIEQLSNHINIDMYEQLSIATINKTKIDSFSPNETLSFDTFYCASSEVAKRIKETLGNVKIIITIREQTDWLSAYYLHHLIALKPKDRSFKKFIKTPEGKCVLNAGFYDRTIETYHQFFGKENVFVLPIEQIKRDFTNSFNELSNFLGIEPIDFKFKSINKGIGSTNGKLVMMASKLGISDDFLKKLKPLYQYIKPMLSHSKNSSILKKDEIELIKSLYSASNLNTQRLIDYDLKELGYCI